MRTLIFSSLIAILATPAWAEYNPYDFCHKVNREAGASRFRGYLDDRVLKEICTAQRLETQALKAGDDRAQRSCAGAKNLLLSEYTKRYRTTGQARAAAECRITSPAIRTPF